jgi:hypothetical protein
VLTGVLTGAGVGMMAAGLIGVLLFPDAPAQLSAMPSKDGAAFAISGRF